MIQRAKHESRKSVTENEGRKRSDGGFGAVHIDDAEGRLGRQWVVTRAPKTPAQDVEFWSQVTHLQFNWGMSARDVMREGWGYAKT